MSNTTNKYVSPGKLSTFLDGLRNIFAPKSHTHPISDLTDYVVDSELSSTSTNPVQNAVINEEFDAVATAMNALDSAVSDKADADHTHDITEVTDLSTTLDGKATVGHGIYYGVCEDMASTSIKKATLLDPTGFSLTEGVVIIIKFKYSNSVSNPKLNVNSTGALSMMRQGGVAIPSSAALGWSSGAVQIFVYDGTNWVRDFWYNSTYTNVNLGHGYGTCDTEETTTAKVVTATGLVPANGGFVAVYFANAVPANSTLTINSTADKEIYYNGAAITDGIIKAGDTATFVYDDSIFHLVGINRDAYTKDEVDSAISTAVSEKADTEHDHTISDITDLAEATQTSSGLLSAEDKIQLDHGGIPIVSASSTDGVAYTATVDGINAFTAGVKITIIPDMTSTSMNVTLDVNGLGAKYMRMPITLNNAATSTGAIDTWIVANRPVLVEYDGINYWKTISMPRPSANSLYGSVPVQLGGTYVNSETTEDDITTARENLGVYSKADHEKILIYDSGLTTADANSISNIDVSGYNNLLVAVSCVNVTAPTTRSGSAIFTATNGTTYQFPVWTNLFLTSTNTSAAMAEFNITGGYIICPHASRHVNAPSFLDTTTEGGTSSSLAGTGSGMMKCTNTISKLTVSSLDQDSSYYFGAGSRVMVWGWNA